MRKRVRIGRATKILSCVNGRIVRYTVIALCAIVLCSCTSHRKKRNKGSWETYCEKYNVDPANPTKEQETYYMDCYHGSVEEDQDMSGTVSFWFNSQNVSEVVRGVLKNNTYYIVYTDTLLGFDHECICVDIETANMVKTAMKSKHGQLCGYLVLDKVHGVYNYNHELK